MLVGVLRSLFIAMILLSVGLSTGVSQSAKVLKVLPHFLDRQGRHTLNPSLFERDAYQFYLRQHREEIGKLRYDIQWNSTFTSDVQLVICLELIGSKEFREAPLRLEETISKKGIASRWTAISLTDEEFNAIGEVLAWRVTIWDGDRLMGERKSFLWVMDTYTPPKIENDGEVDEDAQAAVEI